MLVLLILQILAAAQCMRVPHPKCTYSGGGVYLSCEQSPLEFPTTFTGDAVATNVQHIDLNCPRSYSKNYCNVLQDKFAPLPFRSEIVKVVLSGFRSDSGQRTPIHEFLKLVRQKITTLSIQYSVIKYLDAEYFRGFSSLKALYLSNNDITSVDVNTFQALTYPTVPVLGRLVGQKLHTISLSHNALQELDWSAFQPLGKSLENIHLESQNPKLKTLERSGRAFRLRLRTLSLHSNGLPSIDKAVLTTLTPLGSANFDFDFRWNNFCLSNADCSCCDIMDFLRWIGSLPRTTASTGVQFTCGSKNILHGSASTFKVDHFRSCAITSNSFMHRGCHEVPPLEISCHNETIKSSLSDLENTDASRLIISAASGSRCSSFLTSIKNKATTMTVVTAASVHPATTFTCAHGNVTVRGDNRNEHGNSERLTFINDLSLPCQQHFDNILQHVGDLMVNFDNASAVVHLSSQITVLAIEDWLADFQVCPLHPPLIINCTNGVVTFSERGVAATKATTVLVHADQSFRCRNVIYDVHRYIVRQETTKIESASRDGWSESVVAVCQKGQVVLSDGNPDVSLATTLEYHSAPNALCRKAFYGLLNFVMDNWITDCFACQFL
ncbi:uncharacterized protein LOC129598577 [Paramacrobiotus metropolitanus]|uniref:uncharacterized protein LOC129598577 n=1 Tax=Paramacrobiotus metropolitanus TaxID=2943436 RepID=UPI002445E274|nr:uncharacterized protein LOC129598577 [Paramacrobiotus metropolitanus]